MASGSPASQALIAQATMARVVKAMASWLTADAGRMVDGHHAGAWKGPA